MKEVTILCALKKSNYKLLPGCDVWDKERNAYLYTGSNPIIAHPPCQQWSRLKRFAREDKAEKELAFFCLEKIKANSGILEHPAGSSFFKEAGIKPTISINQFWFGFPAKKTTWLYFHGCGPGHYPLNFDLIEGKVENLSKVKRSETTIEFAEWLLRCVRSG